MIERPVDFERPRWMRCGTCGHEWPVTAEWLGRFSEALEACPTCGTNCESENRPNSCAWPDDPSRDDATVHGVYWYHSSTHENWPDKDFDPAVGFTTEHKLRMEKMAGRGSHERWAARQKAKALHVGTYESAIENMFRRMRDQDNATDQFYLYRVRLSPDCVIEPGVHKERSSFFGDVQLTDVCGPDVNVLRYVNVHEDPSSISIAVDLSAIRSVQGVAIPLAVEASDAWVLGATARLRDAAMRPPVLPKGKLARYRLPTPAVAAEAHTLEAEVAGGLPPILRDRFRMDIDEVRLTAEPAQVAAKLAGLARLATDPQAVLDTLDSLPWRAP